MANTSATKKYKKIRKAVIPVAGYGTRFLPATIAQPKEMLTVIDKPVIQYIVEEMVAGGIEEIVFVTGRGKRAIEDHFDYSAELEQSLRESGKLAQLEEVHRISQLAKFVYVRQNKMLGNGHALLMAKEIIGDEPFAFSFGDDVIESAKPAIKQLIEVFEDHGQTVIGTMKVPLDQVSRFGVVKPTSGASGRVFKVDGVVEKPEQSLAPSEYAVTGRYIFTPDIFKLLEKTKPSNKGEIYISDAVNMMAASADVYACEMAGKYFDCGNKLEYIKANIHYALQHPEMAGQIKAYINDKT